MIEVVVPSVLLVASGGVTAIVLRHRRRAGTQELATRLVQDPPEPDLTAPGQSMIVYPTQYPDQVLVLSDDTTAAATVGTLLGTVAPQITKRLAQVSALMQA